MSGEQHQAALYDAIARVPPTRVAHAIALLAGIEDAARRIGGLTGRQRDVLALMAEGLPNKTIGPRLGISGRTVEIHRASLLERLRVKSTQEAFALFVWGGAD